MPTLKSRRLQQSDVLPILRSKKLSVVQVTQGNVHFPRAIRDTFTTELGPVAFGHVNIGDMDLADFGVSCCVSAWRARLGWPEGQAVPNGYYLFQGAPTAGTTALGLLELPRVLTYRPFTFVEAATLSRWLGLGDVGADYEFLGLGPDANEADLKKAYRATVHKTHPDKKGGDGSGQAFIRAQAARDRVVAAMSER